MEQHRPKLSEIPFVRGAESDDKIDRANAVSRTREQNLEEEHWELVQSVAAALRSLAMVTFELEGTEMQKVAPMCQDVADALYPLAGMVVRRGVNSM